MPMLWRERITHTTGLEKELAVQGTAVHGRLARLNLEDNEENVKLKLE